jgi:hypothetical protein
MFAPAARIAEDYLDVSCKRKYRKLIGRRMAMLSGLVGTRVSVPSGRGSARCDRRSSCSWWGARRRVREVCVDGWRRRDVCVDMRRGMPGDHGCDMRLPCCRLRATAGES